MKLRPQLVAPETVPAALARLKNWLTWDLLPNEIPGKKPRKVPFYANGNPREGSQGTTSDRSQLVTLSEALEAAQRYGRTGLGLAILPDSGIVALDFDNCIVDGVIDPNVLGLCTPTYTEVSPSGNGLRAFMRGSCLSRKDSKGDKGPFGVEVFGHNGFVTFTGNVLEDCKLFGTDMVVCELTPEVTRMYTDRFGSMTAASTALSVTGDDNDAFMLGVTATQGWSIYELKGILDECDPGADRAHWLNAIMAVHHETGASDEGLNLADAWSSKGANYSGRKDVETAWRSLGRGNGTIVTGLWLKKWHKECTKRNRHVIADDWKRQVSECTDQYQLREELCPKIAADERLGDFEREMLAAALSAAFKDSFKLKLPIAQCRKMVAPIVVKKQYAVFTGKPSEYDYSHLPEWVRGWVYVTTEDKFYKYDSPDQLTITGFNAKYNRFLEVNEDGNLTTTAARVALDVYGIPTVTSGFYFPLAGPFFSRDGSEYINTYRPSSVPKAAAVYSEGGRAAINIVRRHIDVVCTQRAELIENVTSYLAHNVQRPGDKINWTIMLKGIEGDGKSVFSTLMSEVMGWANTKSVSPLVIGGQFNGYAAGACLAFLEELFVAGQNRYEKWNAVKPLITNDRIELHPKGQDPFMVLNTQNYIAFTNYADSIPLEETDRRCLVIFSPFKTVGELDATLAPFGGTAAYFSTLFTAIQEHSAELRKWLLEYQIPATFDAKGRAPMTAEKQQMVAFSVSETETVVRELLEKGGSGITSELFSSSCLSDAVRLEDGSIEIQTTTWNRLLSKLGFSKFERKVKWQGRSHWIWSKGGAKHGTSLTTDEIRKTLNETVTDFADLSGEGGSEVDLFS